FFQAEDGIRDDLVTGVQTCALPIYECDTSDSHAATVGCWLNTVAIFRQPSIRRNLICPLATRLKSRTSAASSLGSEPCVFTRRQIGRASCREGMRRRR